MTFSFPFLLGLIGSKGPRESAVCSGNFEGGGGLDFKLSKVFQ